MIWCDPQPLPGDTVTPLEPKYRVFMLGRRGQVAEPQDAAAALEEAACAARLFGQVEAAAAGTSCGDALDNGHDAGRHPT